ncbi:PEP-CTERM system histidine kinase PrsK [Pseudoroseomonas wenyumeiae]|uniref:histidine kinase n=1 Tax=Teichococcus wenyumeiae TaxID=2478470 RepID=A0A3A9J3J0_9PROT|nr:XrtA/PEP-CTERM system histidine kinase PrsK [Pseudoroseomonas wenyumeiae]RKK01022.1 PEP-CTERM system histidine kinase PrsK [Pseudoroseomonas wenyumeiae]RMI14364.1 PEP-CTERM system histidine kinase PrsK [Pseudoroseomonas wenyumeiae]
MIPAVSPVLYAGCAAACLAWSMLVLAAGRGRHALLPAATCFLIAAWAAAVALMPEAPLAWPPGGLEVLRNAFWFLLLLALGRRVGGAQARPLLRRFALAGGIAVLLAFATLSAPVAQALTTNLLGSPIVLARLALVLLVVLLAENLYRNADDGIRWHVVLPCVALGGLAAFDVILYAHAALTHELSPILADARAVLAALAAPLLALGAMRDRRWRRNPSVSRQVVFHGATLLVAGAFLLAVGAAGEALRHLGADWARAAEIGLWAGTAMALAVALSARSVRSLLRRTVVDHFFTARYDYRQEWLRCVTTLSAPDVAPSLRAIRAIADAADSPAGALLLREGAEAGFHWAGSWNMPGEPVSLADDHPLILELRGGSWIVPLAEQDAPELRQAFGQVWLAVPLAHHRDGLLGLVLLAPPRVPLPLDGEVFDLLRSLGREVAMFLAERRAAERLAEQQQLQDHAQRFAFVAHDVKTVASQLTLLLANAEHNIQDPEFQRDMLLTVRASATRINTLIARLRQPEGAEIDTTAIEPLARLRELAARSAHPVQLEHDDRTPLRVSMAAEAFDAAITHLLSNAAEASQPGEPVRLRLQHGQQRVVVEVIDRGCGMTPEFIRDHLFRPLATDKPRGSGIGAWQARELLRRAGGELAVHSRPGEGTTMRMTLPACRDPRNDASYSAPHSAEAALP